MPAFDFDLFVIGGGSGGVRAARVAAGHGARVAIAEESRFGGTCVIRGCVPKKLMVYAARYSSDFQDAKGFGWQTGLPSFDWASLIAAKDKEVARLEKLYRAGQINAGVTVFDMRATVAGPQALRLADGSEITAGKILVATGGRPNVDPALPGVEHVITSDKIFDLPEQPRQIVVAGGGYIAVEFASIFAGLGSEVTLIYRGDKVLRGFDAGLREGLMEAMAARGIRLVMGDVFTRIEKRGSSLVGTTRCGETLMADRILFAIGRSPNVRGLGLEEAGVELDAVGAVVVDGQSRSSVPSIFAVGDVTNRVNLTPVAIREGHAFADTQFGAKPWSTNYANIPTAVFTTPELGTVGLSEETARASGANVDIYEARFRPMRNLLAGRDERTLMKLVVDGETGRVLGVHVLGPDAAEMVQMAAIALNVGALKADFDRTMALHPSAAEELVTLRTRR
jgi:glutathione reductase (NADPH)